MCGWYPRRSLEKVVPPSEPLGEEDEPNLPRSGFWIEVRDAKERPCYRRVIGDPMPDTAEVPAEDGHFTRIKAARENVTFALLVPDLDEADHVSLLRGTPIAGAAPGARSGEIARLPLRAADREDGKRSQ